MREIKFRAWDKQFKKMRYFDHYWLCSEYQSLAWSINEDSKLESETSYCLDCDQEDLEIMQFTGLKDENGNDIWEGDILHHDFNHDKCCDQTYINAVVEWKYDGWALRTITNGPHQIYDSLGMIYDWSERTVIGNIYENSELLNAGEAMN